MKQTFLELSGRKGGVNTQSMSLFAENVLKLMTGSVVAQGLAFVVTPLLTRVYAPEAFGLAALFTAITGIVAAVSCLRYELAIMLPENDQDACNLVAACMGFVLLFTVLTAIFLYFAGDLVVLLLNSSDMQRYLWLMPVSVFAGGTFLALRYWFTRHKRFGAISKAQILSSGIVQADKLGMGYAGHATGGSLIVANLIGQLASVVMLGAFMLRNDWQIFRASIGWKKLQHNIKAYKNFPIYSTWSVLLNTASLYMPAIILSVYFSHEIVGFYALGRAVLGIPLTLLGGAIGQVFFQKASQVRHHKKELSRVVEAVFKRLMSLGMLPIVMLMFVGEDIFVVAFGEHWAEAGIYVQILALLVFFQFISSPISMLFSVLDQQRQGLYFNLLLFATRMAALIVGGISGDVRLTMFLFAWTGAVCYGILSFWLISKAGVPVGDAFSQFFRQAIYMTPVLMLIVSIKWFGGYGEIGVLVWSGCSLMSYYLFAVWHDKELRKTVLTVFVKR